MKENILTVDVLHDRREERGVGGVERVGGGKVQRDVRVRGEEGPPPLPWRRAQVRGC